MNKEDFDKAEILFKKLDDYKKALDGANYTQLDHISERSSVLSFTGYEGGVIVPTSLYRVIGKLIQSEYISMIKDTEERIREL